MNESKLSVREIQHSDIALLSNYWFDSDKDYLVGMGVDVSKLPTPEEWKAMLEEQISQTYENKAAYCIIWELDKKPIGHSNINKIIFGKEAFMHLHLWNLTSRKQGIGSTLVKMTLPFFFNNFKLQTLYCEPYALNPAPNKTLEKVGFNFEKEYITTPGWVNFEQPVKRWKLSRDQYQRIAETYIKTAFI